MKKQSIILACIAVLALLGLVVATFVYKHSQDEKRALLANVFEASDAAAATLSLADLKSLLK